MEKLPDLQFIGILHGDIANRDEAPKNYSESDRVGELEIYSQFEEALDGIAAGQTIVVLFWLHQASRDILKVHPRGDKTRKIRGVFATRSPARPNPIAISEFKVLSVDGNRIMVSGVDILDGTPIIDIKKQI